MLVDQIVDTIVSIHETQILIDQWRSDTGALQIPQVQGVTHQWDRIFGAEENLKDWYSELGQLLADATRNWDRDELMSVFQLLEE